MKIKRIGILLALVAALAFAAGSAVVAYADQAASQIYACVNNSSGTIHVIDAAAACAGNEVKLVWNTQGPQGVKGDTGAQGIQGVKGTDGKTVLSGAGAPAATLGSDGDFYIDTAANAIYGPKASGAWGNPTSLVGPQGAKGDTGLQGVKGDPGTQGIQGPAGANGVSGYTQITFNFTVPGSEHLYRAWATCPVGTVVLGGGPWLYTNPDSVDILPTVIQSAPTSTTTWEVKIDNAGSPRSWDYALVLTCARAN